MGRVYKKPWDRPSFHISQNLKVLSNTLQCPSILTPDTHTLQFSVNMGLKDCFKALSKLVTPKLVFEWGESFTSSSNVIKTEDLRCDVHRDFNNPGYTIAKI
jgi:hypothetical protein